MNKILNHPSAMRQILLPLFIAGAVTGITEAATSGVRIHRIGDPPLPPRAVDTRSASSYRKQPTPPNRLARPIPARPAGAARVNKLPLAPEGYVPPTPAPAPAVVPAVAAPAAPAAAAASARRLPLAPAGYVPPTPAPAPAVAAPAPAPAPQPAPQPAPAAVAAPVAAPAALPIAPTASRPVSRYAPAPAPAAPVAAPAAQPAPVATPAAPAPAPAPKQRRRLPIAPIVADGSTDLPPVPAALIRQ